MNYKTKQAIVLVMVAIMTVSTLTVIGVTTSTKVQAVTKTVTLLEINGWASDKSSKVAVGVPYSVRVSVGTATGGVNVGKVVIYRQVWGDTLKPWKVVSLNAIFDQRYIWYRTDDVQTRPGGVRYLAGYGGWPVGPGVAHPTSEYSGSWSSSVGTHVKYATKVDTKATALAGGSGYKVSGTLSYMDKNVVWTPLRNHLVYVYKGVEAKGDLIWVPLGSPVKTNANGRWSVTDPGGLHGTKYRADYKGSDAHWPSNIVFNRV